MEPTPLLDDNNITLITIFNSNMIHLQRHTTAAKQGNCVFGCTFSINGRFSSLSHCLPSPQRSITRLRSLKANVQSAVSLFPSISQVHSVQVNELPIILMAIRVVHTHVHFTYPALKLIFPHPHSRSRCARYGTNYSLSPLPQEWSTAWAAAGLDSR